jgi:hypothetical protein
MEFVCFVVWRKYLDNYILGDTTHKNIQISSPLPQLTFISAFELNS